MLKENLGQVQKGKCKKASVTLSGMCHEDNRRTSGFPPKIIHQKSIVTTCENFLTVDRTWMGKI